MHCQNIKPDFLHASVCLKEILLAFNGTVITSSDIIHSSSNTQSSSTQRKQVYLDSTILNTLYYLHSNSNLQVNCPNNMTLNYDPEEFCSNVTSADWPATLTMSLILATVAPAAEMGVMATCTC